MPELPFMADDFCNELLTDSSAFLRESAEPSAAAQPSCLHEWMRGRIWRATRPRNRRFRRCVLLIHAEPGAAAQPSCLHEWMHDRIWRATRPRNRRFRRCVLLIHAEPGAATQNASWHMPDGDAEPIENQRIRTGDGQQDETGNENEADRYGKACSAGGGCGTDCRSN